MNILRRLIILTIGLLFVSCAYAYFLVNDRESRKNTLQIAAIDQMTGDPQRGKYVATMGGCIACHTNYAEGGKDLAGGVPIETPFGTFFSPNITSDKSAGIGQWTTAEFLTAMTIGVSPDNEHYYPSFPYTSYSVMAEQDLVDLKAWLDTVAPISTQAPTHDIQWPLSWRMGLTPWKALFFDPLRTANKTNRGQYLIEVGHCAECHSQRNAIGGLNNRSLSGNTRGPEGESVPGITATDLSLWTIEDLELFLEVGITDEGDFTGGHMVDVIEYSTGLLTAADRTAIATYLLSEANK